MQQIIGEVHGKPILSVPEQLYMPPKALKIFLEQFLGPLDLLLFLIRKKNVDILDIDVLSVTKQYLSYIEAMQELAIDISAEYLLMASTLTEIKSRMLLPRQQLEQEDIDLQQQLLERLQQYDQIQQAARSLDSQMQLHRDFTTANIAIVTDQLPRLNCTMPQLATIFEQVVKRQTLNQNYSITEDLEPISFKDHAKMLHQLLPKQKKWHFSKLIRHHIHNQYSLILTVLVLLEFEREALLQLTQNTQAGEIYIDML